ncbi:MAG: response regulator transcription factor [Chloroflexi bacterium]|nr:response regulator transcription factor [Chloroflexota bacterium]
MVGKTVLVIEDEVSILDWIRSYLQNAGFTVLTTTDGVHGLALVREHYPDLIVLDLNLPNMDGLDVCRAIRQDAMSVHIPVIMLTARVEESDRLIGLEIGADDYMVKPFSPRELVARVRAMFRRMDRLTERAPVIEDRGLLIDLDAHVATLHDNLLHLTPNEFRLLSTLIQNRGRALSRQQLIEKSLGHEYDGLDRSIDVYIRQLRSKVEADPARPERIITVYGVGYRYAS